MKKIATIVLTFYFLFALIGIKANIHFCHGYLQSIELFSDEGSCCCETEENENSCCKNQAINFQLEDNNWEKLSIRYTFEEQYIDISYFLNKDIVDDINDIELKFELPEKLIPPNQPKWLLNCSLTFYG